VPFPSDTFDGQGRSGKVQKQAKVFSRRLQVGAQGRIENGFEFRDRFQLHNDGVFHKEVQTMNTRLVSAEIHRNLHLARISEVAVIQCNAECLFVDGFQKSRAQFAVDVDRRANDSLSEVRVFHNVAITPQR